MPAILVNPAALSEAERELRQMAEKDRWLGELAMRVSAGGMKLVADGFNKSVDPYDKPWEPLKRWRPRDIRAARRREREGLPVRGPKVLIHTGRMRGSVGASPSGQTAKVVLPTWYARFHQEGRKNLPRRQILPDTDRPLPDKWESMVEKTSRLFMFQRFGVQ